MSEDADGFVAIELSSAKEAGNFLWGERRVAPFGENIVKIHPLWRAKSVPVMAGRGTVDREQSLLSTQIRALKESDPLKDSRGREIRQEGTAAFDL